MTSTTASARRLSLGLLLWALVAPASLSLMGCFYDDEEPACDVTPGMASETRDLELGRYEYGAVTTFVPYAQGEEVYRDRGEQGGSHLTVALRFAAMPGDGVEERCMLATYESRGEVGEDGEAGFSEFVVRRRFQRSGDFWESVVIDTGARNGRLDVLVRVEDNMVRGSGSVRLAVVVER